MKPEATIEPEAPGSSEWSTAIKRLRDQAAALIIDPEIIKTPERVKVANSGEPELAKPKTESRPRGTGSIFLRGRFWHIAFSNHGRQHAESSHSEKRADAERLLRERLRQVDTRTYVPSNNLKFAELFPILEGDYVNNGMKSLHMIRLTWKLHLDPYFRGWKVSDVNDPAIAKYIKHRLAEGAKNATINRELSALHRACVLAVEVEHKLGAVPHRYVHLKERNRRTGFLAPGAHLALLDGSPIWFRLAVEIARTYGWRASEIVKLRVKQIDLAARTITLFAGETKNGEPREAPITDALHPLLVACITGKKPDDQVLSRGKNGVKSIRHQWHKRCAAAGLGSFSCRKCGEPVTGKPLHCAVCGKNRQQNECKYTGLLFHDLRRTAAKNLIESGADQATVMDIGGWLTPSVFHRYRITDPARRKQVLKKAAEHEQAVLENSARTLLQNVSKRPNMDPEAESAIPN